MTTYTYGTLVNPQCFVEIPDPAEANQTKRPDPGLVVRVRDPKTLTELPSQVTTAYGYLDTWTVEDVPAVQLSVDNGASWAGPILSKEAFDQALIAASGRAIASLNGVKFDGTTDGTAAFQSLMERCYALGLGIWCDPGVLRLASMSASGIALRNPGVSIEATPGKTTFRTDNIAAAHMWIGATLSTTAVATVTADVARGDKAYTVDKTTGGWGNGDLATMRMRQNASDIQEARQAVITTITVPDGTHVNTDVGAEWAVTGVTDASTSEQPKNRQFTKITSLPKDVVIRGIRFEGDALTRHAIGIQWGQHVVVDQCVGSDVGSGLVNGQWCDGFTMSDCVVEKCGAYGNPNKGRAVSLSNMRNALITNLVADNCEGAQVYVESYSTVRIENLHVKNRATTRSQTYNIFCGQDCVVDVDGYTHSGSVSDSIVSYGTQQLGGTACTISNATIFAPLSTIRQFPLTTATGMFRVLEADGTMRTFNTVKLERSQQPIDLVAGTSPVKWLRAGLHIGYEVLVTAGVPANSTSPDVPGLTLTIGRTSVASVPLDWEAGKVKRSSTWVGGGIYPMASAYTQGTKVTAAVRAGATLPAGAKVVVTLLSLSYEGWADTINEPGSAQVDRFLSGAGTTTSGGGGSSSVSYDGLPPNIEITVPKTGGSWPSTRPFARTDLTAHLVGPGDPPGWMTGNDYQTQTPS